MSKDDKKNTLTRRELITLGGAALVGGSLPAVARAADEKKKKGKGDTSLPQVPRRVLGKTGETIPILLVGGGVKLDPRFDPKLAEALRFGINYVDAADCYGGESCEPAVGSFVGRLGERKKYWITSKSDEHEPGLFAERLDRSLERLGTDYVDMYFLHALDDVEALSPALEKTVAKLKKAGKMRFFGFSCHDSNVAELLQAAAERPWVDAVMFRYNFRRYGEKELNKAMDAAHKSGVGLIAMKTQGSESSFEGSWKTFEKTGKWNKHQAVLKAVWADERITAAVSAMKNFDQLKENIAAALDKSELSGREWEALWKYADATRSQACDGCEHLCNPAVDAPVKIGTTLRYLMYHDAYEEPEEARRLFRNLPAEARRIAGLDYVAAQKACPHDVDIPRLMARAADVLV